MATQVAGRALSKHAQRSTDGWWGQAEGAEGLKNFRAEKVILKILQNATWINIHSLPVCEVEGLKKKIGEREKEIRRGEGRREKEEIT